MEKSNQNSIFSSGILKQNPLLVLLLGIGPALGASVSVKGALAMGVVVLCVLVLSNIIVSLIKKVIPQNGKLVVYLVISATLVGIAQMVTQALVPELYAAMGIYLPILAVNVIILSRAEVFASKNSVLRSALDGLAMGLGYLIAIFVLASVREVLGDGTWLGIQIIPQSISTMKILTQAPGGFLVLGVLAALVKKITKNKTVERDVPSCDGCSMQSDCAIEGSR